MRNKSYRLQIIIDLIKRNKVSSQNELAVMLKQRGIEVTQATLSRDLKTLRVSKVPTADDSYMYIIPDSNNVHDSLITTGQPNITAQQQFGFVSIDFSGNMVVIKTRNGYAAGLAYDIDMSRTEEILGTIPGADTVFAILREGVTHEQALRVLSRFIPVDPPIG